MNSLQPNKSFFECWDEPAFTTYWRLIKRTKVTSQLCGTLFDIFINTIIIIPIKLFEVKP